MLYWVETGRVGSVRLLILGEELNRAEAKLAAGMLAGRHAAGIILGLKSSWGFEFNPKSSSSGE